jgi:hypothetical protein
MSRRASIALAAFVAACSPPATTPVSELPNAPTLQIVSPAEAAEGFTPLFDGKDLAGWRGYKMNAAPAGWMVENGELTRTTGGGDLVTETEFANFELRLDWKISPGGNSGIFYRGTEEYEAIYWSAPEMQVLDDAVHADGKNRLTAAGSAYALYAAPAGVVKGAGEWNSIRLVVNGNKVEHWLNGQKVVEYELGSADWTAKVAASKFNQWPGYGKAARGHIGLQDHGDRVWFRNIRVKMLP